MLHSLSKRQNFKTPEGAFAIPFYFYQQHARRSGASTLIANLDPNSETLTEDLKAIRAKIKKAPIDIQLLKNVNQTIAASGYKRIRFRSSTNAEDLEGFSGAGLYKSKTGMLNNPELPIDLAIKKVWASLWSEAAYLERSYYNINSQSVYMGILVHRSFPTEAVNGVAITKNLYRPENFGFVVNAQLGEMSVVNPDSGIICDQFICYPAETGINLYSNKTIIDIITQSNLADGDLVMSEAEIQRLANQLESIKRYFSVRSFLKSSYLDLGFDIEFKLDGPNRDLYIKQIRPYGN